MKYIYFIALLTLGIAILYFLQTGSDFTYNLYYYDEGHDKELNDGNIACDDRAVVAVPRTSPQQLSLKEIISILIQGKLTGDEQVQGFQTEFPHPYFQIISAQIVNGEAQLTFTEVPGFTTGGSCRVGLLRAQIEKTALEFPGVQSVKILPEGIFEP